MRKFILTTIIALFVVSVWLYVQEKDTAQGEQKIKLELVWEKEIPSGVSDFVFLDEDGYNVFSVQCKDPEKALREKRILMIHGGKLKLYEGDAMRLTKEMALRGGNITISKNGRNIATIEGLEQDPSGKGGFVDKPATLRLYNWKGEELAIGQISPAGWEYINLYPLGNDKTIAMSRIGGEGTFYRISVFVREGLNLVEKFTADGQYPTGTLDYAEDGSVVFFLQTKWDVSTDYEERIKYVERIVIDGAGKEIARYTYQHPGWAGWISPKGNYLAEVTRGKYLVIRNRDGKLVAEHHVQGQGNYYAAFSPDEKYLCVTPGPWRIYFFETETGKMLWEYEDTENTHFSSVSVLSSQYTIFAGRSEAILKPGEFKGTIDELNRKVIENETKDRAVYVIRGGELLQILKPFAGEGFGTQLQSPSLQISSDEKFLLVITPSKSYICRISIGGER